MSQRFAGKNCIVTGAGSGVGRATAIRLANEGAKVWCVDIHSDAVEETAAKVRLNGGVAMATALDVSDEKAVFALVDTLIADWQHLDVLCNIAGIGGMKRFDEMTPEFFHRMLAVNLTGPFLLCRASIKHLLETKGNIVNMASTAGVIGQAYVSAYATAKHGLVGLTRSIAMEYAKKGLRCNAICPGAINTPLINTFAAFPEGIDTSLINRYNFLPFFSEPEEIAGMVAYVASAEARYVNGAVLAIDGGITAG